MHSDRDTGAADRIAGGQSQTGHRAAFNQAPSIPHTPRGRDTAEETP